MPTIQVNGTSLHYEQTGSGVPVVALHGGPGADHRYMRGSARDVNLILPDLRGQGRSGRPPIETLTMKQWVDDIHALVQKLDLGPVVMLGHSFGGFLTLNHALRYPEDLAGIVLTGTGSAMDMGDKVAANLDARRALQPEAVEAFESMHYHNDQEFGEAFAAILPLYFDNVEQARIDDAFEGTIFSYYAGASMGPALMRYNLTSRLKDITVPTLILHGKNDFILPIEQARRLHRIPGSKLVEFEGGHFPWLEQPERYYGEMKQWIEQTVAVTV